MGINPKYRPSWQTIPHKVEEYILKILAEAELTELGMICVALPVAQTDEH